MKEKSLCQAFPKLQSGRAPMSLPSISILENTLTSGCSGRRGREIGLIVSVPNRCANDFCCSTVNFCPRNNRILKLSQPSRSSVIVSSEWFCVRSTSMTSAPSATSRGLNLIEMISLLPSGQEHACTPNSGGAPWRRRFSENHPLLLLEYLTCG